MKRITLLLFAALMLIGTSCKKDPSGPKQPKPISLTAKSHEVISANNEFGINLFKKVAAEDNTNLMLSPLSASTALTMLLNGCNTQTYIQVRDMLGYQGLSLDEINKAYNCLVGQLLTIDPEIKLALANSVWYDENFPVRSEFLGKMDSSFQARISALDFSSPDALSKINGWANDNTYGKIPKVLDQIEPQTVMFLMNALYFKGNWTWKFDENQTSDMAFYADENTLNVKMMKNLIEGQFYYGNGATSIELPYGQQNFAMILVLPDTPLDEFLPGFDAEDWASITAGLDSFGDPQEFEVILPKFKFEYEKELNDQLKALGMLDAFEPELADLSGISDFKIYVDFVKQNTFVDVNEEGTEAAAVTTIGIKEVSMPPSFIADKPFIFAIRERLTNTLLFIGKVELPEY